MADNHIFYDTETTGAEPRFDQILQQAAILTDDDFNEIESFDERSRLASHIVPAAGALKVTHIDPYTLARAKHSPFEFARFIHNTFPRWSQTGETAFGGFNSLRFDEEIQRQMFWENLLDPYITSKKGTTRPDYLHFLRGLYARNPDVIDFPIHPTTGKRSFKLELVAPANGFDGHDAHDALGDVRATIFIARLIREIDPALFNQMMLMSNAGNATSFVENQVVFQLLGGAMLDPGAMPVCFVASEAANTKNKVAWNLNVDPTPFLDLSAEEILERMKKTGTPFRTIKCNKTPGLFPMTFEFLNRVKGEGSDDLDAGMIDVRAELIRSHVEFQVNVAEALRPKNLEYGPAEHLEEKIYEGFPSWSDKNKMEAFHRAGTWEQRLEISRDFEKPELRQLAIRTIFVNAPDSLPQHMRLACSEHIEKNRLCLETGAKWNTVGSLMAEIHEKLAENPDDEEMITIRRWALETYTQASKWTPPVETDHEADAEVASDSSEEEMEPKPEVPSAAKPIAVDIAAPAREGEDGAAPEVKRSPALDTPVIAGVSFLDGLS